MIQKGNVVNTVIIEWNICKMCYFLSSVVTAAINSHLTIFSLVRSINARHVTENISTQRLHFLIIHLANCLISKLSEAFVVVMCYSVWHKMLWINESNSQMSRHMVEGRV